MENESRRGRYPKRDPETTKRRLLEAVGYILKEKGYAELGVNEVERHARVSKKNIYTYFGSFDGLIKTYIKSKDFWEQVFEKFALLESPTQGQLRDFLVEVFQDQFRYFFTHEDMQKVIFWQAAEEKHILKQISDEREASGEEIARLTDPHFAGSGVNLRAVLALVMGGIYYMVWHSRYNKSVVIGMDINTEKGYDEVVKTIGQLIEMVWDLAGKRKG